MQHARYVYQNTPVLGTSKQPQTTDTRHPCAAQLVLRLICLTAYNLTLHPLAGYPGPLLHRASSLPFFYHEWRGTTVHKWAELHARYGETVRIAPDQLSYTNPSAWRDIYGVRGTTNPAKDAVPAQMDKEELVFPGESFEFFAPAKPMISCDAADHARHRRAVAPAFSDRAIRTYEPVITHHTTKLLDRLEREHDGGEGVNIVDWLHYTLYDATAALVFGRSFGNLDAGRPHPWVARLPPGMKLIARSLVVTAVPGLGRVISWVMPRRVVEEARRHVQCIIDMSDARRVAQSPHLPHQKDFMSYILPHVGLGPPGHDDGKGAPPMLSAEELYLDAQLLCIAGSETTVTLMCAVVFFLCRPGVNGDYLARLVDEVRGSFATEEDLTPAALNRKGACPFLGAVISEALRLFPPGAINMPRTVPKEGAVIDGGFVPGGMTVGVAPYAAYRAERFWVDAGQFRPERWLEAEDGKGRYASDTREVFKPFGYGPRNCVGQALAMVECRVVIARLFWRFDAEVLGGQDGWMGQKTFLSWEKPQLMVKVRRREARG